MGKYTLDAEIEKAKREQKPKSAPKRISEEKRQQPSANIAALFFQWLTGKLK